ncbi:MAG TPA: zinc-binding dehydrogenase [Steroidobacteraceae bacterium]
MQASAAAILVHPRSFALRELQPPVPGSRQVRVRLQGCGVCASSLPVWEGRPWFRYPLAAGAPGHEGWGVVDAIGAEVDGFAVGDRVAFLSEHAYARYDIADAGSAVKVPESLAHMPFPGEPFACALNIFRRSDIREGQTVAIVGIGFLGTVLTALASRAGARVIAFSRRPFSLELAGRMGAHSTISLNDVQRALREFRSRCREQGAERVIEATGSQEALDLATELTAVRARLIIAGYHQDGARKVDLQKWNWRGIDVINAHEREPSEYVRGMREAVDLVARGALDLRPLLTHRFPLEEMAAAFETLRLRPPGFVKALVVMD